MPPSVGIATESSFFSSRGALEGELTTLVPSLKEMVHYCLYPNSRRLRGLLCRLHGFAVFSSSTLVTDLVSGKNPKAQNVLHNFVTGQLEELQSLVNAGQLQYFSRRQSL